MSLVRVGAHEQRFAAWQVATFRTVRRAYARVRAVAKVSLTECSQRTPVVRKNRRRCLAAIQRQYDVERLKLGLEETSIPLILTVPPP